ncbi:MAG: DegT/DnrJ/EryC1/StrS family aminotransferase [Actinobacteria bacterium]|nr:MAG: DegT/DnrJ/EryC1/StrS family aminotransferase [Actinomycetota bacterium]
MSHVAVADPRATLMAAREELLGAFAAVLERGRYILSEEVAAFEREWAARCGVPHAIGVSSGTDALALALRAVGVGPGDEVLVPAMTAIATWMAVSQIGAVPVGVDIEPDGGGMDPEAARRACGPRTRALVVVHLFGQPANLAALGEVARAADVPLIEDAAQAHRARLAGQPIGSLGAAAAFSFYPTKNLGAVGDAGAVTTPDPAVADRVRVLREYGWRTRADAEVCGVNARLDEVQAAFLRVMLGRLDENIDRRREIAAAYLGALADVAGLELPVSRADSEPVWHLFAVRHPRRDALAAALEQAGIGTAVHYETPPHLNTAFRPGGWPEGSFPVAERHARTALSLPMHPALRDPEVDRVIEQVNRAASEI